MKVVVCLTISAWCWHSLHHPHSSTLSLSSRNFKTLSRSCSPSSKKSIYWISVTELELSNTAL